MSRFARVPRRPDHWSSPHERARFRAAERIDSPLDPAEAAWLDAHLTDCADCRAVASAYDADRIALRALRDAPPQPPRDLWARTSAGIEREARRHGRPTGQQSRVPLGALSGIAVVAIVVGATALSGGWLDQPTVPEAGSTAPALGSAGVSDTALSPGATPMVGIFGSVQWMEALDDGGFAVHRAPVDEVCPIDDQPGCAALEDQAAKRVALTSSPRSITGSPTNDQAVVVSPDGSGGDQVFVMALPKASDAPRLSPEPTVSAAATESAKATASAATGSTEPAETATTEPTATATDTTAPSGEPTTSAEPTVEPTPSDEPATPEPTPSPTPVVVDSPQPTATALAIASGVTVVGQSAAFSADGTWFAFTARPADDSKGPDIYVWHTGEDAARKLTSDGMSTFGSWDGNLVVGSRPVVDDTPDGSADAVSFVMDPTTGEASEATIALWRPVIDPTDRYAVAWDGTVVTNESLSEIVPGEGELILTTWQADASTGATRSRIPGGSDDVVDFDIRWDETGTWVAIWTARPNEPTVGRLSLFRVDRDSGVLESPKGAPTDVPALPGFSIGDGRLAWATPHGQDAEGSKVQVVAWSGNGVGAVESVPGEDVVVVR